MGKVSCNLGSKVMACDSQLIGATSHGDYVAQFGGNNGMRLPLAHMESDRIFWRTDGRFSEAGIAEEVWCWHGTWWKAMSGIHRARGLKLGRAMVDGKVGVFLGGLGMGLDDPERRYALHRLLSCALWIHLLCCLSRRSS